MIEADILHKLNRSEEAVAAFDRAIELDGNNAWFWHRKGETLRELQQYTEALTSYEQALKKDPKFAKPYNGIGNVLYRNLKRYEEAIAAYQRATELEPNYMWAWHNMGNVLHELRRFEEAFKAYRRTTEIDPSYFWAWHNMGDVLHAMGRLEEALEAFDQAIERDDRIVVTWREKGKTFQDLKRYEEALIAYERALELKPNNAQIWIRKGEVLRALKHYQEAVRAYEQALQLDSKDIDAFLGQGRVYLDLGRYQDALDVYEQATQVASNNTWTWHDKGVALAKLGRVEEALAAFEQAIKLTPENRWAWLHKAETLEYLAQQAYEKAKLQREGIVQGTTTPHSAPILNEYLFDGRNILNATAIKTARVRHDAPGADSPAADVYATFWAHFGSSAQDGKRVFKEGLPGTNAEWDGIWEHVIDGTGETLAMDTNDYVNIVTTEKIPLQVASIRPASSTCFGLSRKENLSTGRYLNDDLNSSLIAWTQGGKHVRYQTRATRWPAN